MLSTGTLLNGFQVQVVERSGVRLHTRSAGDGPPLLLMHGHPHAMAMWHKVAPHLLGRHRLVLMDLRGYGDSSRPPADPAHAQHSKREMALDAIAVMRAHGFDRFDALALWRERAPGVTSQAPPCGHYLAEELPEQVAEQALSFFQP